MNERLFAGLSLMKARSWGTTSRRRLLRAWLTLCAWGVAIVFAGAADRPQNVLVLIADDLGRDLGCYGAQLVQTPQIDRLAAAGTRFERAFCTTASCSPSRSVMLTGLFNHTNGQYGLAHPPHNFYCLRSVQSLPALLSAQGYRTGLIGKLHVQPADLFQFDVVADEGIRGGRYGKQMADNARAFIEQTGDKPFFLWVGYTDPHRAKKGFANGDYPGMESISFKPEEITPPPSLPNTPEVRADLAEYYSSIARLDQGVGQMLDVLRETGHWNDTLVLFLSDNGRPFPGAKTTLYEPGVHLPLIVRAPHHEKPGIVSQAMVSWIDLAPTILDFSRTSGPKTKLPGRSLLPILYEEQPAGWDTVYLSHTFHEVTMYYPVRGIRTWRFKLLMNLAHELPFPFASDLFDSPTWQDVLGRMDGQLGNRSVEQFVHRPRFELYDLELDPHELKNLAEDPQHQAKLNELRARLQDWQVATKDPWQIKYEHE
jgi:N-sulfoglucosamine sulfohydrolase